MNKNIDAFLKVLDPSDNSTGGGSASAVSGAMASALVAMVSRLSLGKKGMKSDEFYQDIASVAENLATALFSGGHEDSEAFAMVSAAYKKPKVTELEKKDRSTAIREAMIHAAKVPLKNAGRCREILNLSKILEKKFNSNAASDLQCAQYLAKAGLSGCAANVRINLPYIKDRAVAERIEAELEALLFETETV